MDVEKILDAGSGILDDVMTAVETNQFQDLGKKIQGRVSVATEDLRSQGSNGHTAQVTREDQVYTGSVEPTNKRDGIYQPNYAEGRSSSNTQQSAQKTTASADFSKGAYSSDAYRRYSSERRQGPNTPNSSSQSRMSGSYSGSQNRAGYQKVYGNGAASGTYSARPDQSASASHLFGQKGAYGQYDYRNPDRAKNLQQAAMHAGKDTGAYQNAARQTGPVQRQRSAPEYAYGTQSQRDFFAPTPFNSRNVSKNTGLAPMVFGSMGMAMGGIGTVFTGIIAAAQVVAGTALAATGMVFPIVTGALITGVSGVLFSSGKKKKDMVNEYYQYGRYVGNAEYFKIDELAGKIGIAEKKLRKKLEQMKKQGLLPQARMDDEQEMLLLTDQAYDQYRNAADSYKKRQQEEEKRENYFTAGDVDATVKELLREGNEYLKKVRHYNDLIPDTLEMSNKLYRLESIMYKIFEQVKKKPETAQSLRKFMEYYLPTTEKLLSAYIEVDKQPQVGDNITNTKKEIESAMDTINDAFEKLLDSLFEDLAWDVSSDISVMKTMLQQDGLTGDELQ
ncbi:MAG: 5-bromo-4-chloroindolyl phosphate hydrolysis family protein [Lachnospiraceae bacterium]|nr:5-bromo-4-chloroindolyl phosphate hydrolysis family protein [Lachnospiraceae bacterium]